MYRINQNAQNEVPDLIPAKNSEVPDLKQTTISLTQHTLGLITMICGGVVLFAFLLDLIGLPLRPWSVLPLVLLLILSFGYNFWFQVYKNKYSLKGLNTSEYVIFLLVMAGVLAYGLWLGKPFELPVGTTVDAVHQFGLADYISRSGRLPIHALNQRLNLQDGLQYPPAFVIVVSLLAQTSGIEIINLLHPVTVFFVAIATGTTFAIASLLLENRPWRLVIASLASGLVLLPYGYTFDSFISQTYYAQIMAEAFLMLSLYMLLMWTRNKDTPALILFGLSLSTLLIAYPTLAFIPLGTFGLAVIFARSIDLSAYKIHQKLVWLASIYVPISLLALLFLKDRLQQGIGTISNEGEVLLPDLSRYGWPVVILAGLGLIVSIVSIKSFSNILAPRFVSSSTTKVLADLREIITKRTCSLTVTFCGLLAVEALGLWLWKIWFNSGSFYSVYKMFYPAVYLFPLLATMGLDFLLGLLFSKFDLPFKRLNITSLILGSIIFCSFLVTTWTSHPKPSRAFPIITQDNVKVAEWMEASLKISETNVGYNVIAGGAAYWLQVGYLKQPRDVHSNDLLLNQPLSFEGWMYAPDSPQYLFTDSIQKLGLDASTKILFRSGDSAVLTRTADFQQALLSRPNVAIQYKMTLDKNILDLYSEATLSAEFTNWLGVGLQIVSEPNAQDIFTLAAPAEKGRIKKQFLDVKVSLPQLQVKEFYSNNNYPSTPKNTPALVPGSYSIYVVIQKQGTTVERRKLLDFTIDAGNHLSYDLNQHIINGQFLFEGELPQNVPSLQPLNFELASGKLELTGLNFPSTAKTGETIPVATQWQLSNSITQNYRLQWFWLDSAGNVTSEFESLPRDGLLPTWLWSSPKPVVFTQKISVPSLPGRYELALGLIDINTGAKTPLTKSDKYLEVSP